MTAQRPRRPRRLVAGIAAVALVPLAGSTASASGPPSWGADDRRSTRLPQGLPTAGLDRDLLPLLGGSGRVSVMLELDTSPAVRAYRSGLQIGRGAAKAASREATADVEAVQAEVSDQFSEPATRARELYRVSALYSGIAVVTTGSKLSELAALPGVRAIHRLVPKTATNSTTVPLTRAPQEWTSGAGGTGAGVTIGVIDTGIDYTHAHFGGPGTTQAYATAHANSAKAPTYPDPDKVAGGRDFVGDGYNPDLLQDFTVGFDEAIAGATPRPDNNPLDCDGHGSHVSGSAAGYGVAGDGSTYAGPWNDTTPFATMGIAPGMAPQATLYGLKVFGCEGSTEIVAEALDWAADPNGDGDLSDHLDVVNMSLGSDFGSPDDPDSVAANNAVKAGITVVASMGNSGDQFEVGGSPGDATGVIAVAASDDATDTVDGLAATIDGVTAPGSPLPALRSEAYSWATKPGVTNALVATVSANWVPGSLGSTNADGCAPFSAAQKSRVAGKVALLMWDDDDSTRRCGSAARSANAVLAGAVGAVLGSDAPRFTAGITGDPRIPVMLANGTGTQILKDAVDLGSVVRVTMTDDLRNSVQLDWSGGGDDPTDQIADFSSRGVATARGFKPDVAAPGVSVFSAAVGTGNEGIAESGTSMASPHTAGLAALVVAGHPSWRPEQVKAAIMNTASHDVYVGPGQTGQTVSLLRAGVGRIDAVDAVATESLAYVVDDPGSVNVSFGTLDVSEPTTYSKQVRVENTAAAPRTYALSVASFNALPGAVWSVAPTSLALPAGTSATVTVTLALTPSLLDRTPDPALDLDALGLVRSWLQESTAELVVNPSAGPDLSVGLYAAPRPASTMKGTLSALTGTGAVATGTLSLAGAGISQGSGPGEIASLVSAFELAGTSAKALACSSTAVFFGDGHCVASTGDRSADLRAAGVASNAVAVRAAGEDPLAAPVAVDSAPSFLYFAVSTWGSWRSPVGRQIHAVLLDTDRDSAPDLAVYTDRVAGTDLLIATTVSVRDQDGGAIVDQQLLNDIDGRLDTAIFGSDALVLPVSLNVLAHPTLSDGTPLTDAAGKPMKPFINASSPRFNWSVESADALGTFDAIGEQGFFFAVPTLSYDPVHPAVTVSQGGYSTLLDDQPGNALSVRVDRSRAGLNRTQGILLLHHHNAGGQRAQTIALPKRATTTALALSASTIGHQQTLTATATVKLPGLTVAPSGGSVAFVVGGQTVGAAPLVNGKAVAKLTRLPFGNQQVIAKYRGVPLQTPSTSTPRSVTVTKTPVTVHLKVPTTVSHTNRATAKVTVHLVHSTAVAKGTFVVLDGKKVVGQGSLGKGGTATVKLIRLAVGKHTLVARFHATPLLKSGLSAPKVVRST